MNKKAQQIADYLLKELDEDADYKHLCDMAFKDICIWGEVTEDTKKSTQQFIKSYLKKHK